MRSRYAAYAVGEVQYVLDTTHPAGPHFRIDRDAWVRDVREFCASTRFVDLEVLEQGIDTSGDPFVTFRAGLVQVGQDASFVERSRFRMHGARWKYLDGAPVS
jgi:SEC-C motif domain protein